MTTFAAVKAGEGFWSLSLGGPFERQLRSFRRNVSRLGGLGSSLSGLGSQLSSLGFKLGGISAGMAAIFGHGVGLAASAEQTEIAFSTLLGSATQARRVMEDLRTFAAETPFRLPELRQAARNLAAFGVSADSLLPTLRMLGDISAGSGNRIGEIAEIFGKAKVQGRLFGEDINQLTGRGIPVIAELAAILGTTESQIKAAVSAGEVGFPELEKAFKRLTGPGARFGGMMAALAVTTGGTLSTLQDNLGAVSEQIGRAFLPAITRISEVLIQLARPLVRWVKNNQEVIFQLGLYVPRAAAAAAALIGIGTAMTTAGGVVASAATAIGAALTTLAGPAGPILGVAAAFAGIAAAIPGVRDAVTDGFGAIHTTIDDTAAAAARAFQDGSLEDAVVIITEGMKATWQSALDSMRIAYLEFAAGISKAAVAVARAPDLLLGKDLDEIIAAGGQPGSVVEGLRGVQAEIDALQQQIADRPRQMENLERLLANKRAEERTARAAEELVKQGRRQRGRGGLPVVP